jgi:hypothetical protein
MLLWLQVKKVGLLDAHGSMSFDFASTGPAVKRSRLCIWAQRQHESNFTCMYAHFWHGTFTLACFDPVCKAQHSTEWKKYPFLLPQTLCDQRHIFEPPELLEDEVFEMLATPHGGKVLQNGEQSGIAEAEAARADLARAELDAVADAETAAANSYEQ